MSNYTASVIQMFPFGVRETRVQVGATNLAWGAIQSAEVNEMLQASSLPGDDAIVARHAFILEVTGALKIGGVSLQALALITGRTIATAGATPTRSSTMSAALGDVFPYFKLFVRSVDDSGGDLWYIVYKCKLSDGAKGALANGAFRETDIAFGGVADLGNSNKFYDLCTHETAMGLPTS